MLSADLQSSRPDVLLLSPITESTVAEFPRLVRTVRGLGFARDYNDNTGVGVPVEGPTFYPISRTLGREAERATYEVKQVSLPERSVLQFHYDQVAIGRDLTDRMAGLVALLHGGG